MKCPFCGHLDTQVVETRVAEEGSVIRRRRQCASCEKRFTTYERPEVLMPMVIKKDGSRVDFDGSKIRASLALALRKRPVSIEQIDNAIAHIEQSSPGPRRARNRLGQARGLRHGGAQNTGQSRLCALCLGLPQLQRHRRIPASVGRRSLLTPVAFGAAQRHLQIHVHLAVRIELRLALILQPCAAQLAPSTGLHTAHY